MFRFELKNDLPALASIKTWIKFRGTFIVFTMVLASISVKFFAVLGRTEFGLSTSAKEIPTIKANFCGHNFFQCLKRGIKIIHDL